MKRVLLGLFFVGLAVLLVKPSPARGEEASVAVTMTVKPRLTAAVTAAPRTFEVRPSDRGHRLELPVAGQVASNHGWIIVLELPEKVLGPDGYSLDESALVLEPLAGVAGLQSKGSSLATLGGRATAGASFGNTLTVNIPPSAPTGVYEFPIILSVTQTERGGPSGP